MINLIRKFLGIDPNDEDIIGLWYRKISLAEIHGNSILGLGSESKCFVTNRITNGSFVYAVSIEGKYHISNGLLHSSCENVEEHESINVPEQLRSQLLTTAYNAKPSKIISFDKQKLILETSSGFTDIYTRVEGEINDERINELLLS